MVSASQHTPKMTLTVITIKVTRFRTLSTLCGRIGEKVVNLSTCIVICIQGLKRYSRERKFERNIIIAGFGKTQNFWCWPDLDATLEAGFTKILEIMTAVWDTRLSWKRIGKWGLNPAFWPCRLSRPFFGKRNWFVKMVNTIPERNLPILDFAYHSPKP